MKNKRAIIPPRLGWRENAFYLVEVKLYENNVEHISIFYTGYLDDSGFPSGYNQVSNPTYENKTFKITEVFSLKSIKRLTESNALSMKQWQK